MALQYLDRVRVLTSTTGTGAIAIGSAVAGFQGFGSFTVGNTSYYTVEDGTAWEVGLGTLSASGTWTRTTIIASSNSGSAISLDGNAQLYLCWSAAAAQNPVITGGSIDGAPVGNSNPAAGNFSSLKSSAGSLGTSLYAFVTLATFSNQNSNGNYLNIVDYRNTAGGTSWTSASTRIQITTDATQQGYIEWNPLVAPGGLAFGSGSPNSTTQSAYMVSSGVWNFNYNVNVAGNLAVSGGAFQVTSAASSNRWTQVQTNGATRWSYGCNGGNENNLTLQTSAAQSAASATLPFSSTSGVTVGMYAAGSGVPGGSIVNAVTSTSVTLNVNTNSALASGSSVFFYADTGSDFSWNAFNDDGSLHIANAMVLTRSTGKLTLMNGIEGSPIGAVTPAAAAFTSATVSGLATAGFLGGSVALGLTAAGTSLSTALSLTSENNQITTAAAGTGVALPAPGVGVMIIVWNYGANAITVYPNKSSMTINGTAAGSGVSVAASGGVSRVVQVSATAYLTC